MPTAISKGNDIFDCKQFNDSDVSTKFQQEYILASAAILRLVVNHQL